MIYKSLAFWTLVVGFVAFVAKWFSPTLPFDETQIMAAVLFILGLFGITPSFRKGALAVTATSILKSLPFWTLVAGLVAFVINYYFPTFPFGQSVILAFIVYVLGFFQVNPELRARGLR